MAKRQVIIFFLLIQAPKYKYFLSTYLSLITTIITHIQINTFELQMVSGGTNQIAKFCHVRVVDIQQVLRVRIFYVLIL